MTLHLTIGNKSYSSWSLRPWILLKEFGIPFDETVIPLDRPETRQAIAAASVTGRVPVLEADGIAVSESIAIMEFVAELHPDLPIWPRDSTLRALARMTSAEMHAGFAALRRTCPTNFRRPPRAIPIDAEVRADVDRIEAAWAECRAVAAPDGPFLFGAFSAADAMWAPVVNRFHTYEVAVSPATHAYMDAIMALPSWRAWLADAAAEPWRIAKYEAV